MFDGRSYPGEMQTAAFYPLHLVFALFPPDRNELLAPQLYHLYFVFAHVLAAWFMFALIRELGLSRFSALVAGLSFSIGGLFRPVLSPPIFVDAVFFPLLFLFFLRPLRQWHVAARPANDPLCIFDGLCIVTNARQLPAVPGL